jgi:MATE family multidrug resistance protein
MYIESMQNKEPSTLRALLRVALPMVISQASDTVMLFADRLMVSRLGDLHLAASMSGGITQVTATAFFAGLVGYVNAIVAQYSGALRPERCAPTVFQALLLALAAYPFMLLLTPLARGLFVFAGHGADQIELEYLYFRILMAGSIFVLARAALAGFFLGIGKTRVVMIANVLGMIINLPANYLLIYGKMGFPALGLRGAAYGTIIGGAISLIIMALVYLGPSCRRLYMTHTSSSWDPATLKRLLRFGSPAGVEQLLNVAAFTLFLEFMHSYGASTAAAVTVAFNWDIVAFIPMMGMGAAVTAVVGHNIGAGDLEKARHTARVALAAAWTYSGAMLLLYVSCAPALAGMILRGAPGGEAAMPLAVTMIRMMSIYTLADSVQLVFAGALRGAGDTRAVMRISVGINWLFAGMSFVLIRILKAQPVTVWIIYIACVVLWGLSMFLRYRFGNWQKIHLIEPIKTPPAVR